jgi:membrane associated rhomboid family serine protease
MSSLISDIKYKLSQLNILEKIIVINTVVFLIGSILKPVSSWFKLSSDFFTALVNPWTIITYAFLHYDFFHLFFNMLWLYIIARMVLNLFSPKMALNIYFLGAISGGLMFLLGYALLPDFFGTNSSLVGASGAVRALLIFLCTYMPNKEFRVFTFNIKLWYIGVPIVILDLLGLFGDNAGGNLAHLGGAILGYVYAKQLVNGKDIGSGFERFADAIANMFKTTKKGPLKTVHKNKSKVGGYKKADFNEFNDQKKIDVILDKISKSGYDSLTAEEKELLFRAGK